MGVSLITIPPVQGSRDLEKLWGKRSWKVGEFHDYVHQIMCRSGF